MKTALAIKQEGRAGKRARDLGLPMEGLPGPYNAITDVPGVTVGYKTLSSGAGSMQTGVTAILPRPPEQLLHPTWAGSFSMNGNGEMTGVHWIREAGWFTGPITLTNTFSIGMAHHATARWMVSRFREQLDKGMWVLPVAAETYDGWLNDISAFHVTEDDVIDAIESASGGQLQEGNVGGGTGMMAYEFKGGTGTASRVVNVAGLDHTVGVVVQANHGLRPWLRVCGVPVGEQMPRVDPWANERGSIIAVIATDLPLLPTQLERLARRAGIGIGRAGTPSGNNSGDIFLAFSTANSIGQLPEPTRMTLDTVSNDLLDPVFMAVVEAVDEAVINAMLAAETVVGKQSRTAYAIDHALLRSIVKTRASQ
ncbi:DmpA family aminopeptidase [Paraburkholderia nemoris]|uniref:DmpA family aminopeptidase n=1 Tax=Paraburkholderia nemoris TaxID=2793076 RepID=UPI0038B9FB75